MPDFPLSPRLMNQISIGTFSPESVAQSILGMVGTFNTSTVWPTANLAIYVPVEVYNPITIVKMSVNNGAAVSGTIQVGIYRPDGTSVVTSGSAAQTGTAAMQIFDITDTLLLPNLYYMAVVQNNTTGTLAGYQNVVALEAEALGIFQQASAVPLPATAAFAVFTGVWCPIVSMTPKVTI